LNSTLSTPAARDEALATALLTELTTLPLAELEPDREVDEAEAALALAAEETLDKMDDMDPEALEAEAEPVGIPLGREVLPVAEARVLVTAPELTARLPHNAFCSWTADCCSA